MKRESCHTCSGTGRVMQFGKYHTCERCGGAGWTSAKESDDDWDDHEPEELLWPESIRWADP